MKKVFWVSRHPLSPAQLQAIGEIWGKDVEIVHDPVIFALHEDFLSYLVSRPENSFVYAVVPAHYAVIAACEHKEFGLFENFPARRQDGTFGLAAVWHVQEGACVRRWVNPNPSADQGDVLTPVSR